MKLLAPSVLLTTLFLASCGGGERLDGNGLAEGESALVQFARASQLYWRGSLSASREEFNGVIYRHQGSVLAEDARLAVRRIEAELGEETGPATDSSSDSFLRGLPVVVVGQSAGEDVMEWISGRLTQMGCTVETVMDPEAPEVTVVLHRQGMEAEAEALSDSLSLWLSRPESVEHQGGGSLIDAVAPQGGGIMVVVGTDAVLGQ
jgi:hypothetical protein